MEFYPELILVLLPWLVFSVFALLAKKLINFAKKRKGLAVAFGILVQMVLPDPQVENTIKIVVQAKRAVEEDEQNSDDKKD